MAISAFLFDAEGVDRPVELSAETVAAVGIAQLLWVDVKLSDEDSASAVPSLFALLHFPEELVAHFQHLDGRPLPQVRPHIHLYDTCFHVYMVAVQPRNAEDDADGSEARERPRKRRVPTRQRTDIGAMVSSGAFRRVAVHFVVFPNIVITLHDQPVVFLAAFERRIKGDTQLGQWNGPAFIAALLNGHVTGYFRVLETLEAEVDSIDDAALRQRGERNLLSEMVYIRRRVALVRQTLLPHREVYATLSHPQFAPFVTPEATTALGLVHERMERAVEATENARELVLGSFDIFTTQTALRTNEIVKILTVISALLLPAGVLASFSLLVLKTPVYDLGPTGFWVLMAGMLIISITSIIIAHRRQWF
jgi:Mg2+ and Co2+ transporter CorA